MRAELHFVLVHGEVGHATGEPEELLARVAVLSVLPDRIVRRLLGQVVLELEGDNRQAVDEEPDVERPLGLFPAVAKLPGDGEAVEFEALPGLFVVGGGRAVEEVQFMSAVLDAVTEHVDGAAPGDLTLQPGQEAAAGRTVFMEGERFSDFRLGCVQENRELDQIDAVFALVVVRVAATPTDPAVCGGGFSDFARTG